MKLHCNRQDFRRAWSFIKLLRVEPYIFLVFLQQALKTAPNSLFLQDKLCMQWYNTTAQYCHDLPTAKEADNESGHYKNRILKDVTMFGNYQTYLTTIPVLVWALFVGAWIDRYLPARKLLMLFSVGASLIDNLSLIYISIRFDTSVYYNLMTHIPSSVFGGQIAAKIAITHYVSSTTPPKLMAMRFMIYDMTTFVAGPIGTSLGGYFLVKSPLFHTGEIRNYTIIFIIALIFELVALIWIIFMIDEKVARKHQMRIEMKLKSINNNNELDKRVKAKKEEKIVHPLRLLFDLDNVKVMFRVIAKRRPNKARTQLIILLVSMLISCIVFAGGVIISEQFIERVYRWGPDWTSYVNSVAKVVHLIGTVSVVHILTRVAKLHDIGLSIIGYVTYVSTNLIKGMWLDPMAYYLSLLIQSMGGISSIGTRSHLTKIVNRDEIGKVMSFISMLDTMAPALAATVLSYVFNATIDKYPGSVYEVIALMTFVPLFVVMWIDLFTEIPLIDSDPDKPNVQDDNVEFDLVGENSYKTKL